MQLAQKMSYYLQICMVANNIHTYAYFKRRIPPPVWSVFIWGRMKIGKIQGIIGATAQQLCMQPAISGSREHSFAYIITAEPLDFVDILHLQSALGARQPLW